MTEHKPTSSPHEAVKVIRCENCTRERPVHDVFWHAEDRAWYCQHVFACEARLFVLSEREGVTQT